MSGENGIDNHILETLEMINEWLFKVPVGDNSNEIELTPAMEALITKKITGLSPILNEDNEVIVRECRYNEEEQVFQGFNQNGEIEGKCQVALDSYRSKIQNFIEGFEI